jgi:hypothetical protein
VSSWRVNAIHTELSSDGLHEHISEVKASSAGSATAGIWLSRATVVTDIRSGGDDYYTEAAGNRAKINVVRCPRCTFPNYLRSERDATTADNLLSLPRN